MRIPFVKSHAIVFGFVLPMLIAASCLAQCEWELSREPILLPGGIDPWDEDTVCDPAVIFDDGLYHMWYTGVGTEKGIGYATSENGFDWVKFGENPVITLGWSTGHPSALKAGDLFIIYFSGTRYSGDHKRIYRGTSPDGVHWELDPDHPVLDVGASYQWDENNVFNPFVIDNPAGYRMYYAGEDGGFSYRIGVATSDDGIDWTRFESNPILLPGSYYEWDFSTVNNPNVCFDGETYHMWYSGMDDYTYAVGYASSEDGYRWRKHDDNPVINSGPPHSWYSYRVDPGVVFGTDRNYYMVPSGTDGYRYFIGLGISPVVLEDVLSVTLTPDAECFHRGENFGFSYRIENLTGDIQIFDTWADMYFQGIPLPFNPVWGPADFTLPPHRLRSGHYVREIPEDFPLGGPFTLRLKTGEYPAPIWAQDDFDFYIVP